jgi:hypothetical protein
MSSTVTIRCQPYPNELLQSNIVIERGLEGTLQRVSVFSVWNSGDLGKMLLEFEWCQLNRMQDLSNRSWRICGCCCG